MVGRLDARASPGVWRDCALSQPSVACAIICLSLSRSTSTYVCLYRDDAIALTIYVCRQHIDDGTAFYCNADALNHIFVLTPKSCFHVRGRRSYCAC